MTFALVPDNQADREPPNSRESEQAALGSVFIKPTAFEELAANLVTDDFFLPAHREIYDAMLAIAARRQAIDIIAVADELKTRGMLVRLDGGQSYLNELANIVPTAEHVLHYAQLVRDKANLRRLIAALAEAKSAAYGDVGNVADFAQEAVRKVEELAARAARAAPKAADLVDRLAAAGDPLGTDLRTLDENCRGGFRRGRRVIVGGAPGSGKTTLVVGWALAWAIAGVCVAVVAADESAADLLVRVGQMLGLDRDALEAGDPETLARLREELEGIPTLLILDGDDGATIEDAVAAVRRMAGERMAAVVVDGVQTARAVGSDTAEGPRARVDAVLAALRRASQLQLVVVATSELARAAYRARDPSERIEDLAAGKESGGIEYSAQTLLVLRSVTDRIGEVDVSVPKNRGGAREPLRLLIDFKRARVQEISRPEGAVGAAPLDSATQLDLDVAAAREALRNSPGMAGFAQLRAALTGMSGKRRNDAVGTLKARGEIVNRGTANQPRLYLGGGVLPGLTATTVRPVTPPITPLPTPLGVRAVGNGSVGADGDGGPVRPGGES